MSFDGFPPGKTPLTMLPDPFFTELLPLINDLAELKVILFCFWALPQKEGDFPHLAQQDFIAYAPLMASLRTIQPDADPEQTLTDALEKAVADGALLAAPVDLDGKTKMLYVINTERGRTAIAQIKAGHWHAEDGPVHILPARPTIYAQYEANIGPLTPMIADELKDTEAEFPAVWIEEAMRIAVSQNKRSLRYIRAILERWKREGKDDGTTDTRRREQDGKRYVSGKYSDFLEH